MPFRTSAALASKIWPGKARAVASWRATTRVSQRHGQILGPTLRDKRPRIYDTSAIQRSSTLAQSDCAAPATPRLAAHRRLYGALGADSYETAIAPTFFEELSTDDADSKLASAHAPRLDKYRAQKVGRVPGMRHDALPDLVPLQAAISKADHHADVLASCRYSSTVKSPHRIDAGFHDTPDDAVFGLTRHIKRNTYNSTYGQDNHPTKRDIFNHRCHTSRAVLALLTSMSASAVPIKLHNTAPLTHPQSSDNLLLTSAT